ncbi:MAG: M16 family metallopeptidase, partial [Bacteroidota bacterium]
QYLGALPVSDQKEQWKDVTAEFPGGITNATIHKGTEPQSFVALVMNEPFDWSYEKILKMNMLEKILSIRLRKKMREEESEVYGIRVNANASLYPKSEYSFSFVFGCNPAKTDTLLDIIFDEIKKIQNTLPTDVEMQKARNIFIRQRETKIEQNGFWVNQLKNHYFQGTELKTIEEYSLLVNQISAEDIKNAANYFLTPGHYVKLVLKPGNGH